MSFLVEVVVGLVASTISALFGHFFSDGRLRLPRFLGSFPLTEARTTAAGVLGITLSAGIDLSTSDHSHRMLSYVFWYGIAFVALVVVVVCTVRDRRRSGPKAPGESLVAPRSASLLMSHRQEGILADAPTSSIQALRRKAADKAIEAMRSEKEQRGWLKAEIKEELAEDSQVKPVEQAKDQLAGAIRTGRYLRDVDSPVLERLWRGRTAALVGRLFGALEEARLGEDDDTEGRLTRLDELAERVQSGSVVQLRPSDDWDFYVFMTREMSELLVMHKRSGYQLRDDFFSGSDLGNESMVKAWIGDLAKTWELAPGLREAVESPWPAGEGFAYEGLDQQQSDLVGKLDHRLAPLDEFLPVLLRYADALGEPYGDYGTSRRVERERVVAQLRSVADRIEVHVDARQAEQPQWEPTVFDNVVADFANPNKLEHDRRLASYRQETIGLYIRDYRGDALAVLDEAKRLLGGNVGADEVVKLPNGIPQLVLLPDMLRKVADELAANDEPQPVV
jgi:hypothetical protein